MFRIMLKTLREDSGLSQETFAKEIGMAQSTIGMWESGKREPNFETTQKIADFFEVSVDYLLGRVDNPNPPGSSTPNLEDIKFALFEKRGVDDETYEEVKQFAHFTEDRKRRQNEPK